MENKPGLEGIAECILELSSCFALKFRMRIYNGMCFEDRRIRSSSIF
jgi:hypothetical protein